MKVEGTRESSTGSGRRERWCHGLSNKSDIG
jgi:hypothetical protein